MASRKLQSTRGIDPSVKADEERALNLMEALIQESLCANCKLQGDCVYLQKACAPVQACELYECGLSERPRLRVVKKPGAAVAEPPESDDPLLGLCVNCENLRGCNLPRPAGGVWMCEEYR